MKAFGALFAALVLFACFPVESQQDVTVKTLDQKFFIKEAGVVESIWKVTVHVEKKTEGFSFYLNFGTKSYVRDLVALGPKQQPLKTTMVSSESLPLFNVYPPAPLEKEDFSFTVKFIIWEAVTSVGDAGSFDFATGFLYPVEELDLLIAAPPSSRIMNYFPGGGEIISYNNQPAAKWNITAIPAGRNLQIKLEFSRVTTQEADALFGDAMELFKAQNWQAAQDKFIAAREEYTFIGDKARIAECTKYIDTTKSILDAKALTEEANSLFEEEKFGDALQKYRQAKNLFLKAGLGEAASRLDETITKTAHYETAAEWVARGKEAEQKKEYANAATFYRNALGIYTEMGDEKKISETNKILETLKPAPRRNLYIVGILIIALLVVIVFLITRRKPTGAPAPQPSPTPSEPPPSDKKKKAELKAMQTCPFCGREVPKAATVCSYCSHSLSETKEELLRRKEETQKTIDELEKSYISGLVSEEEYKKLRKKWINVLADIEDKLISFEVKKGR